MQRSNDLWFHKDDWSRLCRAGKRECKRLGDKDYWKDMICKENEDGVEGANTLVQPIF